jgi:hypothetical protein
MKKAQTTIEFFMTYGWVIIVIVALVAILIYSDAFRAPVSEKCVFAASSGLFCDKAAVYSNSNITIKLKNSLQEDININADSMVSYKGNVCGLVQSKMIKSKASEILVFKDCPNLIKSGNIIKARVSIKYTDSSGFPKEASGTLVAQVS